MWSPSHVQTVIRSLDDVSSWQLRRQSLPPSGPVFEPFCYHDPGRSQVALYQHFRIGWASSKGFRRPNTSPHVLTNSHNVRVGT